MKKLFIVLGSLFFIISCQNTPNDVPFDSYRNVTFNVNMSNILASQFVPEQDTLKIVGDFNDWGKELYILTDDDSDEVYSITIHNLILGEEYEYKYQINAETEDLDGEKRKYTVLNEDNVVNDCYNELNPTIVIFKVNMNYWIELGKFDSEIDFVDVAGTFNDWQGSDNMDDSDNDGIYETTYTNIDDGEYIEYKFRINGSWDNETCEFPNGGPNRTYTVVQGENILEHWYNDEQP